MASRRAPSPVVGTLTAEASGAPGYGSGDSDARGADGSGQSALGRAADSWRIAQARYRRLRANRVPTPASRTPLTDADLAHVSGQSRDGPRLDGLLHGPDCHRPRAVRPRGACSPCHTAFHIAA